MNQNHTAVNVASGSAPGSGIALLRNVAACAKVMELLINREPNLPGMGAFYGESGLGKSIAAAYCANKFNGVYVECRSYFTKKSLLLTICKEMRLRPAPTVYQMVEQIGEQLALSARPLLIDEMDHIADRNLVEIVRDLYEASYAPILMIGEELFPNKLKRWERFHNRVLEWCPAEKSDMSDAAKLVKMYSPDIGIAPDLLTEAVKQSRGVHRRICVNINQVRQHGRALGLKEVGLKEWGGKSFYTGEAPARRAV